MSAVGVRDGFEGGAEYAAIAVIDAAVVEGAIEQQVQPLADARMLSLTGAAQGQARPRGRFDPREIAFRPGPADQLAVDVVDILVVARVHGPALVRQQGGGGRLERLGLLAEDRLHEENERCRPDRFRTPAFQAICAIAGRALPQPRFSGFDGGGEAPRPSRQGQ